MYRRVQAEAEEAQTCAGTNTRSRILEFIFICRLRNLKFVTSNYPSECTLFMNSREPVYACRARGADAGTPRDPRGECNAGGAFEQCVQRPRVERFLEQVVAPLLSSA